jgi:hypothetical protein
VIVVTPGWLEEVLADEAATYPEGTAWPLMDTGDTGTLAAAEDPVPAEEIGLCWAGITERCSDAGSVALVRWSWRHECSESRHSRRRPALSPTTDPAQ